MRKLLLGLLFTFVASPALAQNTTCSNRLTSDSSNACANTRFVQNHISILPSINSGQILANTSGVSAPPIGTSATNWFDSAYCNTIGYFIVRTTGAWTCDNSIPLSVKWMGAKGDSISVGATVSIASGSGALTASGATFTSVDVGKTIVVPGAGAGGAELVTTILTFTDATHVGLSVGATTALSSKTETISYGTDNTVFFNASFAAASGWIVIPCGRYMVTAAISVPGATEIMGANRECVVITTTNVTGNLFTFSGAGVTIRNVVLTTPVVKTSGALIDTNGQYDSGIYKFKCVGSWLVCVSISGTAVSDTRVIDGVIAGSGNASAKGVVISSQTGSQGGVDTVLRDLFIGGQSSSDELAAGVSVTMAGDLTIDHVSTIFSANGLEIVPGSSQAAQAVFVSNSFFDTGTGWGVFIGPSSASGTVQMVKMTNVWATSNKTGGIGVSGVGPVLDVSCVSCGISANTNVGSTAFGVLINNTNVSNFNLSNSTLGANDTAFRANSGVTNFKVQNNRIGPVGQFGANIGGIVLAGSNDNFTIANNDISGNTINVNLVSYTGSNGRIIDNIGFNPVGTTSFSIPATGVAYTAGPWPETIYLGGGTVSSLSVNGQAIYYNPSGTSNVIQLGPNENYVLNYTAAPVIHIRTQH